MVKYKITVNKDLEMVTVRYDLSTEMGGAELIADFSVFIDGKDVITESASGNTKFFGTAFAKIHDETKDVAVNFTVTSNTDFKADGADILRGGHPFDDASFSN